MKIIHTQINALMHITLLFNILTQVTRIKMVREVREARQGKGKGKGKGRERKETRMTRCQ